jgi:hypothetical protein
MTSCIDVSDRSRVSETDIVNIAIEFLFDGRPMSDCRGLLLSEYDVDAEHFESASGRGTSSGEGVRSRVRYSSEMLKREV